MGSLIGGRWCGLGWIRWRVVGGVEREGIELFIEAVRKNKPVPVPGEECLITQKIIDGIYKSAETGREVRIK